MQPVRREVGNKMHFRRELTQNKSKHYVQNGKYLLRGVTNTGIFSTEEISMAMMMSGAVINAGGC